MKSFKRRGYIARAAVTPQVDIIATNPKTVGMIT
jgi:hypothetical protein